MRWTVPMSARALPHPIAGRRDRVSGEASIGSFDLDKPRNTGDLTPCCADDTVNP
ncbi:MAG: hypothetical protein KatS3mg012_2282 [Gaiellaceae bacterium]|nr:MAG: hypothetical protein KatS3mg012_2282 [Gaiellaceae bacterium]